ncbi:unnamed protein product [Moneuplotes crassus]|uniref:Uncharacterized protein n=1 Tax=Euplotes crassus TaxID=5936 RepID=A0AAD1ULX9_EUPCR|nr:unnamed protein product [Moneuplotes crassus]
MKHIIFDITKEESKGPKEETKINPRGDVKLLTPNDNPTVRLTPLDFDSKFPDPNSHSQFERSIAPRHDEKSVKLFEKVKES